MLNYLMIAANAGNNTNPGGSLLTMLLPFAFIILIMYFLVMRPESKRKKQAEEMRNNLKKGDWITTIGGIYGRVVAITDRTVVIETSEDRVRVEFLKSAIGNVGTLDDQAAAAQRPGRKAAREEPSADDLPESGENMVEE
jgi:preprotein translocase subunit YajC